MPNTNLKMTQEQHSTNARSAADLKTGEKGIVLEIIGDEKIKQRLASMGILNGTTITAPLTPMHSNPRTYKIRGYQLCMRAEEAAMILLQTETETI